MAKKWRVGVVGLGHWYSCYGLARALPEYPKAELVAVAWGDRAQREEFAGAFGIDGHASYQELLGRSDVDIVHIAPPVAEIPDATIKAARAGKHMILGKPMAMTLGQADEMVQAVRASGVTCVPFQGMYKLASADLKRRLEQGAIGEVVVMHAVGRWSIAEDWYHSGRPGWFADPRQVPGGALIDEGIYDVDRLRWLAGSEVVRVEAKTANFVHKEIGVEDWGLATFTFANGVVATIEASWTINAPRKTGPSPKQNAVRRLEIIGTRGEIVQGGLHEPGFGILAAGAEGWVFERPLPEPYGPSKPAALDYLIGCLESGAEPVTRIEDARASLAIALAAYEAATSGQPVRC
ncbi:MAG TPA: Gfo/Idh/MocA family oxidoreductase [Chloroflexota bacterium]|nr:Gfo/Idh/MocA family oxidoreductase [Chloroflexota bacterium]